ncbi:hypothetical protein LUZ60_002164 [Juncus effusus]|nr:hypothetical protein LUZ60_002164 [Juncus effusus]
MGGLEDEEPPSKRIKSLQFCSQNPLSLTQNLSLSTKSPNPLEFGGRMARPLPSKGKQESQNETLIGSKALIRKNEFVRIITKALYSLGYERTGSILEEESGIHLHEPVISLLRKQVLEGNWDESIQTLHKIGLTDQKIVKNSAFLILEQKFFEQLENGEVTKAIKTLQGEISPLGVNTKRVHDLTGCILCPSKLGELGFWRAETKTRVRVLDELQRLFPISVMVPERRLEELVEQALDVQRESCYFHNFRDKCLSLFVDHKCEKDQIPSRTVQVLDAHQDEVWYIQFSNNGKYLATASNDMSVIIWEVNGEGKLVIKHKLTGHERVVIMVSWSPDDRQILTCGQEECVRLWEVSTGSCLRIYEKPGLGLISSGFFPSGDKIYTGVTDRSLSIWGSDGTEVESVKGQRLTKTADVAVTKDGKYIIMLNKENNILILDRESKRETVIEEECTITSFSLSDDDEYLLVNLLNQEIHLWCIGDGGGPSLDKKYKGHKRLRFVLRSCFGGTDQGFIASGSEDSLVYIWHRQTEDLIETLAGHSGAVNCVCWNPADPYMLASGSDDHTVRIWGLEKPNSPKWKGLSENGSCSNGVSHQCNGNSK